MADGMGGTVVSMAPEELEEEERLAMLQELAKLRKRIAALPPA